MTSDLVGINQNFGDTATISGSCGSNNRDVCMNYEGVDRTENRDGPAQNNNNGCLGAQGTLATLPAC